MPRHRSLPVLDRRTLLRGAALALLGGCRLALDDPQPPPDFAAPDAGATVTADGAVVAGTGIERCGDLLCLDLAHPANAMLRDVDGARALTVSGTKLIVVRTSASEVVALSSVCTHAGCAVKFVPVHGDLECPCHGSTFSLDGKVTHGPAGSPLATFSATLDGDVISIAV